MEVIYIYGLVCPIRHMIMYVGKTRNLDTRFWQHIKDASSAKKKTRKIEWLQQLQAQGKLPTLVVIDTCEAGESKDREAYWIAHYKSLNADLTNVDWWRDTEAGRAYTLQSGGLDAIAAQETVYRQSRLAEAERRRLQAIGVAQ